MRKLKVFLHAFLAAAALMLVFSASTALADQESNLIIASAKAVGRTATLRWNVVTGATEYVVFGDVYQDGGASHRVKRLDTVTGTYFRFSGMEIGKNYKFKVAAYRGGSRIATSPSVTTYAGERSGIGKAVRLIPTKTGLNLEVGQSGMATCRIDTSNGRNQGLEEPEVRYYSNDPGIADVDANGNVYARAEGSARIYMVAGNGINAWMGVTVKNVPKTYTITFHSNNGRGDLYSVTVPVDEYFMLPTNPFSYPGYTFTGWSQRSGFGYGSYGERAVVRNLAGPGTNADLYAQWNAIRLYMKDYPYAYTSVTVNYDVNGGNAVKSQDTFNGHGSFSLPTPVRDGYIFEGWIAGGRNYGTTIPAGTQGTLNLTASWRAKGSYEPASGTSFWYANYPYRYMSGRYYDGCCCFPYPSLY